LDEPVQYRHGPKLELYFESMKDTKHVANIPHLN